MARETCLGRKTYLIESSPKRETVGTLLPSKPGFLTPFQISSAKKQEDLSSVRTGLWNLEGFLLYKMEARWPLGQIPEGGVSQRFTLGQVSYKIIGTPFPHFTLTNDCKTYVYLY